MNQAAVVLSSAVSFLFIMTLLGLLFRQSSIDAFRQNLFALRDELFDAAASGQINFDHPAYGMSRSMTNRTIQFAHRLNLPFLVSLAFLMRSKSEPRLDSYNKRLDRVASTLAPSQAAIIRLYHQKLNVLIVRHLVLSSPSLLITVIIPVVVFYSVSKHLAALLRVASKPIDWLDSLIFAIDELANTGNDTTKDVDLQCA